MCSHRLLAATCVLLAPACSMIPPGTQQTPPGSDYSISSTRGQPKVSGFAGVTEVNVLELDLDPDLGIVEADDEVTMPMIGANFQFPFRSERLEWGVETGFTVGWETERDAVVVDTGAVLVSGDNDIWIADLSLGLYVSSTLGERARLYFGAGPMLQFSGVELEFDAGIGGDDTLSENGNGVGVYARAGLEFGVSRGTTVGLMARWIESTIDFGGDIDELDIEAIQIGIVATTGF